jgi:type II secretory pathway pseudopilin PulG
MEQDNKLVSYIETQVRAGVSKERISEYCTLVGWNEADIEQALKKALFRVGLPAPTEGQAGTRKMKAEAAVTALSLFSFVLLGTSAYALGVLYFAIITLLLPDPLSQSWYAEESARSSAHWSIASLIIAFPLYVMALRVWFKKFREEERVVESAATRWLTYLVLFVAAGTVVGDLVAVLYTFLQGEISGRFVLKALTILVVAGAVFLFYYFERQKVQYGKDIPRSCFKRLGVGVSVIVVVGIVLGFVAAGTPSAERARAFDEQRSSDLSSLATCINRYASQYRTLPTELDDLERSTTFSYCSRYVDPLGTPYEYRVVSELTKGTDDGTYEGAYELCATFDTATADSKAGQQAVRPSALDKWHTHLSGRDCDREQVSIVVQALPTLR